MHNVTREHMQEGSHLILVPDWTPCCSAGDKGQDPEVRELGAEPPWKERGNIQEGSGLAWDHSWGGQAQHFILSSGCKSTLCC